MPSKVYSAAIVGIEAEVVEIETEVSYGLRTFDIVGLPDQAISESKERIGVALKTAGYKSPRSQPVRVLVNLAPADIRKEGSLYDLPIALGFLIASKQLICNLERTLIFGELSLEGRVRPVKGALSFALLAQSKGYKELIVPKENALEATLVLQGHPDSLRILGVETLSEVVSHLSGKSLLSPVSQAVEIEESGLDEIFPLSLIQGQDYAKRALEIAAAGSHNVLLLWMKSHSLLHYSFRLKLWFDLWKTNIYSNAVISYSTSRPGRLSME
ncbi:ATP-binding protein [Patescibacteria group bacterium]|nr:ATP-binding protein [Patescibacteria group bacterium]